MVAVAQKEKISPEEAASGMQNFDSFWEDEREKLEDVCRLQKSMPNLFITVAPAEWKAIWHRGVQHGRKMTSSISAGQAIMTLHLNHVIGSLLKDVLLRKGSPFEHYDEIFEEQGVKYKLDKGKLLKEVDGVWSKLTLRSLMVLGEVKQRVNSCSKMKYSRFGTSLASRK